MITSCAVLAPPLPHHRRVTAQKRRISRLCRGPVLDPDPKSKTGRSVRTIGYSTTAPALITVITLDHEGTIHGVNGWRANDSARRYREGLYE
jgi:hypothetical protein